MNNNKPELTVVAPLELIKIQSTDHVGISQELLEIADNRKSLIKDYRGMSDLVAVAMNENYFKMPVGKKAHIASRAEGSEWDFEPLKDKMANAKQCLIPYFTDSGKIQYKNIFDMFTDSHKAIHYDGSVFDPSKVGDFYRGTNKIRNEFTDFAFRNLAHEKIDLKQFTQWPEFSRAYKHTLGDSFHLVEHCFLNICSSNFEYFTYLICWCADIMQNPAQRVPVAVAIQSRQEGTGKSTLKIALQRIIGGQYCPEINSASQLKNRFNIEFKTALFGACEEMGWGGDRELGALLKTLISDPRIRVEEKFSNAEYVNNYMRLMLVTNEDWFIGASDTSRRIFALKASANKIQDTEYFAKVYKTNKNNVFADSVLQDFSTFLFSVELTGWQPTKLPSTNVLKEQQIHSYDSLQKWWSDCLTSGEIHIKGDYDTPFENIPLRDGSEIPASKMLRSYKDWLNDQKGTPVRPNSTDSIGFGKAFKNDCLRGRADYCQSRRLTRGAKLTIYTFFDVDALYHLHLGKH